MFIYGSVNGEWEWMDEYGKGRIKIKNADMCLHKKSGSLPSNGENIHLWSCNKESTIHSAWVLKGNKIQLQNSNYCISKKENHPRNGDNIYLWKCDGKSKNNEWTFIP